MLKVTNGSIWVLYTVSRFIKLTSIRTHMFEQADPSGSDLNKRRQNFRNQVRRNQIDDYFDRRRKELLSQEQSRPQSHRQLLQTPEKRVIFLQRIESQLRETDVNNWSNILHEMIISVGFFEGDFKKLAETEILNILCRSLTDPFSNHNIRQQILRMLIIILTSERQDNRAVTLYLLYYQIVHQIIDCFIDLNFNPLPLNDIKEYLHFFACFARISQKYRNSFIQRGIGPILVQYGHKLLKSQLITEEEMRFSFLGICGDFLMPFSDATYKIDFQFACAILDIIKEYLQLPSQEKTIKQGLRCLEFISRFPNPKVLRGFNSPTLMKRLFEFSKVRRYQYLTLRIFNRIAFDGQAQIPKYLLKIGILDLLQDITKEEGITTNSTLSICLLSNLAIENDRGIEKIIMHPVWKILVIPCLTDHNPRLKEQAYNCVNTFLKGAQSRALQFTIIQNGQIVFKSIDVIRNYKQNPQDLTREGLILLKRYINILAEQLEKGGQTATQSRRRLNFLQKVFHVEQIINQIIDYCHFASVVSEAQVISQIYGVAFMQDRQETV